MAFAVYEFARVEGRNAVALSDESERDTLVVRTDDTSCAVKILAHLTIVRARKTQREDLFATRGRDIAIAHGVPSAIPFAGALITKSATIGAGFIPVLIAVFATAIAIEACIRFGIVAFVVWVGAVQDGSANAARSACFVVAARHAHR